MNVIFFGTPEPVVPILETLSKHFTVAAVITAPDQKAGRKQLLTPPPVKVFAQKHGIKVLQPEKLKDFSLSEVEGPIDLAVVAAYGKIIPQAIIDFPKHGSINIHPSLLPKYRGPTPIQTTLINGDRESGISFIKIDAEMDHGELLQTIPYSIKESDTFQSLMQSMFQKAADELPHIINKYINGELKLVEQAHSQATFTKIITKADGYIDLQSSPTKEQLQNMIRAYFPWPTVWTTVNIKDREVRLKFLPGDKFQLEGKNPVSGKEFRTAYPELREKLEKLLT